MMACRRGGEEGRETRTKRLLALLASVAVTSMPARAEDAGKRDFPATLVVDEPQVETEIAPQIAGWRYGDARRTDLATELSLQLAKPFSVVVHPDYTVLRPGGGGFQALEIGAKYQFVANAEHEVVFSAGLSSTLGPTGSARVGADTYSSVIPTLYIGKGAGDLPTSVSWARPLAATLQLGLVTALRGRSREPLPSANGDGLPDEANPFTIALAGSFQYSLAYASENVLASPLSNPFARLIPLVEYELEISVANGGSRAPTTGTVDPGVLWLDNEHNATWGLEVLIPINRASGNHPGARLQLSYSFDPPWRLAGDAPH